MTVDEAKAQYKANLVAIIQADATIGVAYDRLTALQTQADSLAASFKGADHAKMQALRAQLHIVASQATPLRNLVHNAGSQEAQSALAALKELR